LPRYQLLDSNIVVLLNLPVLQLPNPPAAFQTEDFDATFKPAITYSQGLVIDPQRGPAITHQYESMASQKSIAASVYRVEVHDRSGKEDINEANLPALLLQVAATLNIDAILAVGVNYEVQFRVEGAAAAAIASRALTDISALVPRGSTVRGGTARFYFGGEDTELYALAIEPRLQDLTTNIVWMTCNYNINRAALPTADEFMAIQNRSYTVIKQLGERLFS